MRPRPVSVACCALCQALETFVPISQQGHKIVPQDSYIEDPSEDAERSGVVDGVMHSGSLGDRLELMNVPPAGEWSVLHLVHEPLRPLNDHNL